MISKESGSSYKNAENPAASGQTSMYDRGRDSIDQIKAQEAAPVYRTHQADPEQYILDLGRRLGKKQGEFTIADRELLPEDIRTELIDGVIYLMASPTQRHQIVAGQIYHQLCSFIYSRDGDCTPFIAPSDVNLDEDDKTVVQPDVYIECKKRGQDDAPDTDKNETGNNDTVPDFIAEVLSPSSRKKDMFTKTAKYCSAGVREYWIVDPVKEKVIVHRFDNESDTSIYGFDCCVPVGIYDGACRIDFPQIRERVDRYFR